MGINQLIAAGIAPPQIETSENRLARKLKMAQDQASFDDMQSKREQQNKLRNFMSAADRNSPTYVDDLYRVDAGAATAEEDRRAKLGGVLSKTKNELSESKSRDFKLASEMYEGLRSEITGLKDNPQLSKPLVASALQRRVQQGLMSQELFDDMVGSLPDDPAQIRATADGFLRSKLTPEQQYTVFAPKPVKQSDGQVEQLIDQNPNSPTYMQPQGQAVQLKVSPDTLANNARMQSEGMLNRNNQLTIADRADARAAAKVGQATAKPMPAAALKMQNDALDAIGVSSSINADLSAIENQIGKGKLEFGPVSNLVSKGRNMAGLSNEESRNLSSFESSLERLRNESLRLNTGVQTDGDAQRAWNELFKNITDTELVKQRLAEIKGINQRGAELQQLKLDQVRGNYGLDPLDTSSQRGVKPALNRGASDTWADPQVNNQNAAALEWLKANPNDPRAAAIKAKLGVQ